MVKVLTLRYLFIFLFFAFLIPLGYAQRIISELETNSDLSMDARPDSAETKKKKIVPNDVRAWTVDETYGNMTDTYVDTLHHMFMNTDLPEGIEGTPRKHKVAMLKHNQRPARLT